MNTTIWICMLLLASLSPSCAKPLDWSKMRSVYRELPNFFIGDLKEKILKLTVENLKTKGQERQQLINKLFTRTDIDDIQRNLILWGDYARAELGSGGTPAEKKLMERLDKVFEQTGEAF